MLAVVAASRDEVIIFSRQATFGLANPLGRNIEKVPYWNLFLFISKIENSKHEKRDSQFRTSAAQKSAELVRIKVKETAPNKESEILCSQMLRQSRGKITTSPAQVKLLTYDNYPHRVT